VPSTLYFRSYLPNYTMAKMSASVSLLSSEYEAISNQQQDQWQRKKQTPEQKRAARMAKLDPDNAKSAKDVMDERAAAAALKRKREEEGSSDYEAPTEKQREGLKLHDRKDKRRKTNKKEPNEPKADNTNEKADETTVDDQKRQRAEKKAAKKEKARAKKLKTQQKLERKKAEKRLASSHESQDSISDNQDEGENGEDDLEVVDAIDIGGKNTTTMTTDDGRSTASPSPEIASPMHSPQLHSGSSSISSILPLSISSADKPAISKSTQSNPTPSSSISVDPSSLTPQQRLEARINALRAARKADGPDGRQPRNRQELLESRRRKEEERRAHKKELRRKAKAEELRKQEEEVAKRFSPGGSGSLIASPRSPMEPGNTFSFGRVAFGDGTQADSSLSSLLDPPKRKGPSDANTALQAAQNRASRLSGLDEAKRADIQQKDMWLNAKKKAHGERVKDDTSLLKKALKRQEDSKKKSEKEWQGRIEGVSKSQEMKQKRREQNLSKRRDEKGGGGKKKKTSKTGAAGKKAKKIKRPGFEGSFKTKPGTGRK
jgi:Surfeit locus protein 6/60S ribosome biogenesis protein Rrp14